MILLVTKIYGRVLKFWLAASDSISEARREGFVHPNPAAAAIPILRSVKHHHRLLMNLLLRKLSASSSRCSLLRTIAAAAGGAAGVAYASSDSDFKTRVLVSLPAPLGEHLRLQWPASLSSGGFSSEILPSSSFRTSPVPSDDSLNKVPSDAAESPKHCSGCIGRDSFANAAAKVGPAVVNLSIPRGSYGMTTGRSIGSGTIIDKDGTILTCAHVVVDFQGLGSLSKGKVAVTLQDGRTFEGTVVSADLHSDIAIVKINSKTPLPTANLGSSRKLRPGDWVISLGCPLSLQNTVTAGIVSCVDRKSSELGIGGMRKEYLQTDCAINGGNSGGPLVNIDGEVVGVNIMKVMGADGLGFSVPIDLVSKIITQLKKSGRVVRPWLGLRMVDLNDMIIAQLKERDPKFPNVTKGILVPAVTPESPADRAGFLPGDVVVEFDGKSVGSISEVIEIMEEKIGVPINVKVKRSRDRAATLTVVPKETNPDI